MQRRDVLVATTSAMTTALAGCANDDAGENNAGDTEGGEITPIREETLTLATTTSTYDTGLLDEINAGFEERYGVAVEAVAQGTGAALETARNGDADVVMVHARTLEDEFLREGYGMNRRRLMYNDFVVVGPGDDPAEIDATSSVTDAFRAIADSESLFVSRGDNSGTHAKERAVWDAAGIEPGGEWYREAGDGMGVVLNQADQSRAYTMADRGTFIAQRSEIDLGIRLEGPIEGGPKLLANPYGIVAVNPAVHDHVNYDLAMAYIGYVTSPAGQKTIETYTVAGEQLFFPEALSADPTFEQYVPEGWTPNQD